MIPECPGYVPIPVIISLKAQLQLVQVLRIRASCLPDTVRIILDSHLYGIFRVCDRIGTVGVPGIKGTFAGLHGITALPPGFLHHDGLYDLYIVRDTVLPCIPLNHRGIIHHFLAQRPCTLDIAGQKDSPGYTCD